VLRAILVPLFAVLVLAGAATAAGNSRVAAAQHALREKGVYAGSIDGVVGPETTDALRRFQASIGLPADGALGPPTRKALGLVELGARLLAYGAEGSDVLQLQFMLAWQGFPSGMFDGKLNDHVDRALRKFQESAGLVPDGIAGPATLRALRKPPPSSPLTLAWPLDGQPTDIFGPRGIRFHSGIDIPAAAGTPVAAAKGGRVAYADFLPGGWGLLVSIDHGSGVRTLYAHLSRIDVKVGQRVEAGQPIAVVGATGHSTGPHLHFEVRLRGAAVDPLKALEVRATGPTTGSRTRTSPAPRLRR
jgi:murein DD-endopeptidase MepM/ murein hydrolase activator NlpD